MLDYISLCINTFNNLFIVLIFQIFESITFLSIERPGKSERLNVAPETWYQKTFVM